MNDIEVIHLDPGNNVNCDICNKDFTHSDQEGGFLFHSKGVCPDCEPRFRENIKEYNEQKYIRGECPVGMSFADWIRSIR